MENVQNNLLGDMDLQIDNQVKTLFGEAAKWSRFISIVMFIASGFILIFGIIGGAALTGTLKKLGGQYQMLEEFNGPILIIICVLVAAVIGVTYYFLFNFSNKIKTALLNENADELNAALRALKTFMIITTVLAILSLVINIFNLFQ